MTKEQPRSLPPEPTLTYEQLKRGTNRFGAIDEIVRQMIADGGPHAEVNKHLETIEGRDLFFYVRRSVFIAGLTAHRRAQKWNAERTALRFGWARDAKMIEEILSGVSYLKEMAKHELDWADSDDARGRPRSQTLPFCLNMPPTGTLLKISSALPRP